MGEKKEDTIGKEVVEEVLDKIIKDTEDAVKDLEIMKDLENHIVEVDGEKKKLSRKQELFCRLYATEREFFCNGVQSYIEAYDIDVRIKGQYNIAKKGAYDNLTKGYLLKRIDELIELGGLNDQMVDKQLKKLITQDADFRAKATGIKEYNQLKARITKHIDIKSGGKEIGGFNYVKPKQDEANNNTDNNANDKTGSSVE